MLRANYRDRRQARSHLSKGGGHLTALLGYVMAGGGGGVSESGAQPKCAGQRVFQCVSTWSSKLGGPLEMKDDYSLVHSKTFWTIFKME